MPHLKIKKMVKMNILLVAFCAGACTILSLSMKKETGNEELLLLKDKLNHTDTIHQNDSIFSILQFKEGKLIEIRLKQFVNQTKKQAFGIQTISFYDNGRLGFLKSSCRDTILKNGDVAYEEQMIVLDSLNRISEYQLMSNFKIICKSL
jgi:hypothetical protein